MDLRMQITLAAVAVLLLVLFLSFRFLSQRGRFLLYGVILVGALGALAFYFLNTRFLRTNLDVELYATGFSWPTFAAVAPGDETHFFIIERAGTIQAWDGGRQPPSIAPTPFLDISDRVSQAGSEQGLLSLAFHPAYADNGYFYVFYTNRDDDIILSRFATPAGTPLQADAASEQVLLEIATPGTHHNGGQLLFGPDSYLYASIGDGGDETWPGNAQDLTTLPGSILRLDVSGPELYAVPPDNPFAGEGVARPEIWAYGLRNPWRFAFDMDAGAIYIADVGASAREEVNYSSLAAAAGANYGWRWYEGTVANELPTEVEGLVPPGDALVFPAAEYTHAALGGCSITGGYVYKGEAIASLRDKYLYADYCSGFVWALGKDGDDFNVERVLSLEGMLLTSFAQDHAGELYLVDYANGNLYKIVEQ